jgi:hypothetical protein
MSNVQYPMSKDKGLGSVSLSVSLSVSESAPGSEARPDVRGQTSEASAPAKLVPLSGMDGRFAPVNLPASKRPATSA